MKLRDRRVRLLVLMIAAVPLLIGAARPLNPLVTRAATINGPVPIECEEGLSDTPAMRVQVAELPLPPATDADLAPPPSRALRAELEDAQAALLRNDRPAFDSHIGSARELLAGYPPGAERRAAEDVMGVYDAVGRVWSAQFESPFFDDTSDAYTAANAYRGYDEAVRRQVLVDDADRRFYPAAETRDFLAQVAQSRLTKLGIRSSAPPTRVARVVPPERDEDEEARPLPNVKPKPRHARSHAPSTTRTTSRTKKSHRSQISKPMPAANVQAPAHAIAAAPAPATLPPPDTAAPTPVPAAPALPAAGEVSSTESTQTTATTGTTDTTETTDTAMTTMPDTTTTATVPSTSPQQRSVLIPAILILIGLGVLIVLFRASK